MGPFMETMCNIDRWSKPVDPQTGAANSVFLRYGVTRAASVVVAAPTAIVAAAQNALYTPFIAAGAVLRLGVKTIACLSSPESALNKFANKLPSVVDFLKTVARVAGYAIAAFTSATLGFLAPVVNMKMLQSCGLVVNKREEAIKAELAEEEAKRLADQKKTPSNVISQEEAELKAAQEALEKAAKEAAKAIAEKLAKEETEAKAAIEAERKAAEEAAKAAAAKAAEEAAAKKAKDAEISRLKAAEALSAAALQEEIDNVEDEVETTTYKQKALNIANKVTCGIVTEKRVHDYVEAPAYNYVGKPTYNYVVSPTYNYLVKPTYNATADYVVKPLHARVWTPVYNGVTQFSPKNASHSVYEQTVGRFTTAKAKV